MKNDNSAFFLTRRGLLMSSSAALSTGCFGSFKLTGVAYDFNEKVNNKWLRWLLFLGMVIIPIYEITLLVDAIALNSIEFWTGRNPVRGKSTPLSNGRRLASSPTNNPNVVRHELYQGEQLERVLFVERLGDEGMVVRDEAGNTIASAEPTANGVEVRNNNHQPLATLPTRGCIELATALESGRSPRDATAEVLERYGQGVALLGPRSGGLPRATL